MHTHMTQSDKHTLSRFHLLKIVWIMSCIHEPNQCPCHTCWPVPLGCAFVCTATMTWHYNLHTKIVAHVKRNRYHFLIREGPAASSIEPHRYHTTVAEQSLWPLEMKLKKTQVTDLLTTSWKSLPTNCWCLHFEFSLFRRLGQSKHASKSSFPSTWNYRLLDFRGGHTALLLSTVWRL